MVDEAAIVRLIERVIEGRTPPGDPMTATVEGVPDTSRLMLVRINATSPPIPVWRPSLPTVPQPGDRVQLIRGPEGYLVVDKVLDRDPPDPLLPGGSDGGEDGSPTHHTLGLHTALGLATLTDIATHAAWAGHLITYTTLNTRTTDDGKWSKLGSGTIFDRYGSLVFTFLVNGGGSMADTWTRGVVRGKVSQVADFGSDPGVVLELMDRADLAGADLALVITSNAEPTTFELHARVTREYEWLTWTPTYERQDRCQWEWTTCQAFTASLPAGTSTTATEL